MKEEKHIMTMLVDNEPGVLSRVVGLFSGKGFNIESLCVAPTMDNKVSRITIETKADPPVIEQIEKVSYCLEPLEGLKVYPIFHES